MKPSHFYFDDSILYREQVLFKQARYLGHELSVNNYLALAQDNEARILIKNNNGIECIGNVCRHRQATILSGEGQIDNIVCPLHGWTYNNEGTLIGAPLFDPCPNLNLKKYKTQQWNGLIFDAGLSDVAKDLADMKMAKYFNFENYKYHSKIVQDCNYNWKTFIEVYLDDYHVKAFHPGLGNFATCDNLEWQFGKNYSCQSVGISNQLKTPGTEIWAKYHKAVLDYNQGTLPDFGAIWLTIYPNIMIEWYPHVLVISTVWPETPQKTKNIVEFYYPEEIVLFEPSFIDAHQAAYKETGIEDDQIALRMDRGRSYNNKTGIDDFGPIQDPLEIGYEHFYTYYDKFIFSDWVDRRK